MLTNTTLPRVQITWISHTAKMNNKLYIFLKSPGTKSISNNKKYQRLLQRKIPKTGNAAFTHKPSSGYHVSYLINGMHNCSSSHIRNMTIFA
jgi:hypothetical protein